MKHDDRHNQGRSIAAKLASAAIFAAVVIGMIYLAQQLNTLEDRLDYQPPQINRAPASQSNVLAVTEGQSIYVPVYSHIYAEGGAPHLLETTLSIRNTDPLLAITVTSARYIDTKGRLVREFIDGTVSLGPLQTTEILVEKRDVSGGSGANFMVDWHSDRPVYEPVVEAVMLGQSPRQSISIKSTGRPLLKRSVGSTDK